MYSFLVIIVTIFFGGLLAFLGDRVGMKVGKKRLSIFGLRPKYTSMIITVLTGFFIAGLTLMVLMLMSEYVRTAVFRLTIIQDELQNAVKRVDTLTKQINEKEAEIKEKDIQIEQKIEEILNKEIEYNKLQAERQKVEKDLEVTSKQLVEAKRQFKQAEAALTVTKNELEIKQNRVLNLTSLRDELESQVTSLKSQEERYLQEIKHLQSEKIRMENEIVDISSKPIQFIVGEILVDKVVSSTVNTETAFNNIIQPILQEANEIAMKRGGRIPGKSNYALRVSERKIAEICVQITELKTKAVLRVLVEKNSVIGEPVIVTLELLPNQLIFKKGEVITEAEVTGDTLESDLRNRMLIMLLLAYNKAITEGIVRDGHNLEMVPIQEVARMINEIKADKDSKFKICLIADEDIYRINQLKVHFELRKI